MFLLYCRHNETQYTTVRQEHEYNEQETQSDQNGTSSTTTRPAFQRGEGDHESEGFSLTGLTTVVKNLGQMGLIVAVIALVMRAIKLIDKRRTTSASA